MKLKKTFEYKPNHFWVMVPEGELSPGGYQLELSFQGSMLGDIVGLYMSAYLDSATNQPRYKTSSHRLLVD